MNAPAASAAMANDDLVPMVRLINVSKSFPDGAHTVRVLDGVEFDIARGQTTSLVGASGSGKSTLLGLLAGLMLPESGRILFDGTDLASLDDSERSRIRAQRIGVVVQRGSLIPFLTASQNVELAMKLAGGGHRRSARADSLLEDLGIADRKDHLPHHLSGGEAQRVALAMALVNHPDLLLADEITGELDSATAEQVMEVVFGERRDRGLTVVFVTHSSQLANRAQNRLRLTDGMVERA